MARMEGQTKDPEDSYRLILHDSLCGSEFFECGAKLCIVDFDSIIELYIDLFFVEWYKYIFLVCVDFVDNGIGVCNL